MHEPTVEIELLVGDERDDPRCVAFAGRFVANAKCQLMWPWRQIDAEHHRPRIMQPAAESMKKIHFGHGAVIDASFQRAGVWTCQDKRTDGCPFEFRASTLPQPFHYKEVSDHGIVHDNCLADLSNEASSIASHVEALPVSDR